MGQRQRCGTPAPAVGYLAVLVRDTDLIIGMSIHKAIILSGGVRVWVCRYSYGSISIWISRAHRGIFTALKSIQMVLRSSTVYSRDGISTDSVLWRPFFWTSALTFTLIILQDGLRGGERKNHERKTTPETNEAPVFIEVAEIMHDIRGGLKRHYRALLLNLNLDS